MGYPSLTGIHFQLQTSKAFSYLIINKRNSNNVLLDILVTILGRTGACRQPTTFHGPHLLQHLLDHRASDAKGAAMARADCDQI